LLLPSRLIPEDKGIGLEQIAQLKRRGERRVYRGTQRYAIGMPCGGVAAGQLYILGDGTLGGWHIDGRLNSTGYGDLCIETHRARQLKTGFRPATAMNPHWDPTPDLPILNPVATSMPLNTSANTPSQKFITDLHKPKRASH
jgi:hypothetical protein